MNAKLLRDAFQPLIVRQHAAIRMRQIKHRLLDQGITIQQIADGAGISRTLVSLILKGERKGYRHRAKIARALGLSVDELFNGKKRRRAA